MLRIPSWSAGGPGRGPSILGESFPAPLPEVGSITSTQIRERVGLLDRAGGLPALVRTPCSSLGASFFASLTDDHRRAPARVDGAVRPARSSPAERRHPACSPLAPLCASRGALCERMCAMSMSDGKILVVVDDSPATEPALQRVARMVESGQVREAVLAFVREIPPRLLEHGGGDTPEDERAKQARLDAQRERWIRAGERAAQPSMDHARDVLCRAGLAEGAIAQKFLTVVHDADVAQSLLDTARELGCQP